MLSLNLNARNGRLNVLCIGAHSDDIEIGCGGLILTLKARFPGVHFDWVVFSAEGARGREARVSAGRFLGRTSREITLHQFKDGFFPYAGAAVKAAFEDIKRASNPDLILTHFRDDRHQDHRELSNLTWNTFRNHFVLEYEIPKFDGDLGAPNLFVPLDPKTCERKVKLLDQSFGSQRDKHWFSRETFMGLMRLRGMECRAPGGYAEAFYARKAVVELAAPDSR